MITEILPYSEFATIKLSHFVKSSKIYQLDNWEFMGGIWIGEAVGFTEFLRLESSTDELGSLAIDLDDLPTDTIQAIFATLNLPLKPHATYAEVEEVLEKYESTNIFVEDRVVYNYTIGCRWPYYISCTIDEAKGLIYVVVIRKDILAKCNA